MTSSPNVFEDKLAQSKSVSVDVRVSAYGNSTPEKRKCDYHSLVARLLLADLQLEAADFSLEAEVVALKEMIITPLTTHQSKRFRTTVRKVLAFWNASRNFCSNFAVFQQIQKRAALQKEIVYSQFYDLERQIFDFLQNIEIVVEEFDAAHAPYTMYSTQKFVNESELYQIVSLGNLDGIILDGYEVSLHLTKYNIELFKIPVLYISRNDSAFDYAFGSILKRLIDEKLSLSQLA